MAGGTARTLLRAATIHGGGDLLVRAGSVLLIPLYARWLGASDYAILAVTGAASALLCQCHLLGLHAVPAPALAGRCDDPVARRNAGAAVGLGLAWGLILALAVQIAGPAISSAAFATVPFDPWLRLAALTGAATAIGQILLGVAVAAEKHLGYRAAALAGFLIGTAASLAALACGLGPLGVLIGQALGAVVTAIGAGRVARQHWSWCWEWPALAGVLAFALPILLYSLSSMAIDIWARLALERVVARSDLGRYNLANQYAVAFAALCGAMNTAWTPRFFAAVRLEQTDLIRRYDRFAITAAAALAVLALLAAPFLLPLVGGPSFAGAAGVAPPLLLAAFLSSSLWFSLANPLFRQGRTWHLAWIAAAGAIACGLANLLLLERWGMAGAAWAQAIGSATMVLAAAGLRWRTEGPQWLPWQALAAAVGCLATAALLWPWAAAGGAGSLLACLAAAPPLAGLLLLGMGRASLASLAGALRPPAPPAPPDGAGPAAGPPAP